VVRRACRAPAVRRCHGHLEPALGEAQISQLFPDRFAESRTVLAAFGGEFAARPQNFRVEPRQLRIQPGQFPVALLQTVQLALGLGPKPGHLRQRRAVFALERVNQVQTLLELPQALGSTSTLSR